MKELLLNHIILQIYEDGKILNTKTGNYITGSPNNCGYYQLTIAKKKYLRSHLIATAYCENPYHYTEVDHIDGDITNDTPSNLRWVSHSQNQYNRKPGGKLRKIKLFINNLSKEELQELQNYILSIV